MDYRLDHKHCVFCGTSSDTNSSVCCSPLNCSPFDTVGNRHHAYPVDAREQAKAAVERIAGNYGDQFPEVWEYNISAHEEFCSSRNLDVYEYDPADDGPECHIIANEMANEIYLRWQSKPRFQLDV